MKKRLADSFFTQIAALVIAVFIVHVFYISIVGPNAEVVLEERMARLAANEAFIPEQSIWVILRDIYQETCFILMFWAFAIMGLKAWNYLTEKKLLEQKLVNITEGMRVLPEDARTYMRHIQALPDHVNTRLLPRTIMVALQRFESTQDVHNVAETIRSVCDNEANKLDSELSMIRYIAWAIPSIGFIGTVRGIGDALSQAYLAVQGDIAGVTESLGVAFNSTFVALVVSIVIMLFVHQLQRAQEQLVIDTQMWCDEHLVRHMQVN